MSSATRIIIGLSGGVDSAVAALLLKRQGLDVHGLFMANWDEDDSYCSIAQDFQDARAVCKELDIPLHRVNFAAEYRQRVFAYFLAEHRAGRTPNPDVLCNREIKFGVCLQYARRLGSKSFATGHYARHIDEGGAVQLHKAHDLSKDQSYFLHALELAQLDAAVFPLADLDKSEVRRIARNAGLPVFNKPDSTGICFIGERPFREFLSQYVAEQPGPIKTPTGEQIGTHRGLAFYTLGQRGGLAVGGLAGHEEQPWYVAVKDSANNTLIAVQGHDHPLMQSHGIRTGVAHWLIPTPTATFEANVKLRYRQADQSCLVYPQENGTLRIDFMQAQRAVTPGQFAVLYSGTRCLGGAVIDSL